MAKILVTGITGLVGGAFVTALLRQQPETEIVALARSGGRRSAAERVKSVIQDQCAFDGCPEVAPELLKRIRVIDTDVANADPAAIAAAPEVAGVDTVFHCAADVNLGKDPSGKTFHTNYHGTENMVNIAKALKVNAFHYVSTAYVAGRTSGRAMEAEANPADGFNNPYEESKCKGERLVRNCGIPFTIYRPAIITGRRSDGKIRKPLAVYRVLEFMAKLKSHRCSKLKLDPTARIDLQVQFKTIPSKHVYFVPIDYVQSAITTLFQQPVANQTYHVTGDSPVSTMMIDEAVCRVLQLEEIAIDAETIRATADDKLMDRFLGDLFPYFSGDIIFDQTNVRRALGDQALAWKYGADELAVMIRTFYADHFPNVEWLQTLVKRSEAEAAQQA